MAGSVLQLVPTELRCNKCGVVKPLGEFWADNRKSARNRAQRSHYCRVCLTASRPRHEILPDSDPRITYGRRICSGCGVEKGLAGFSKSELFKMGRETRCKACKNAWKLARRGRKLRTQRIEPTVRDYNRLHRSGISSAVFRILFDAQEGRCGICAQPMDFLAKSTCVDHSHKTGMIRGVLCGCCNLGIGHMKDDISLMRAAITYLEKHGEV
jgi:hypothetical protein